MMCNVLNDCPLCCMFERKLNERFEVGKLPSKMVSYDKDVSECSVHRTMFSNTNGFLDSFVWVDGKIARNEWFFPVHHVTETFLS